ncbi:MAG: hypothetical protein J3Q66DRAFT_429584 [Benniella sp.]|nr:MAG: hypothetical protein J3Q66DRAFT_429584 [Benniella sp.]
MRIKICLSLRSFSHTFSPLPYHSLDLTMPALTDKIFLPISIFILNVVLAAFKFVLASAVGACFAIYAMRGCEYAKSVGWIRSSGYRDMITTSYNTFKRKDVPGSVKWALIVAFIVTLVANFLDKGIASLVDPSFRPGHPIQDVVVSPQAPYDGSFFGWSFVVPTNGSVVDTMKQALNSPIANPSPEDGYVYSPVISEYTPVCTDFGFGFQNETLRNGTGCMMLDISFLSWSNGPPIKTERSPNRWSITMGPDRPGPDDSITEQPVSGQLSFWDPSSLSSNASRFFSFADHNHHRDFHMYPRTTITKCIHDNSDITVVAMTTTRFLARVDEYDSVAANYFSTYHSDDLLSTMKETITTKTIPAQPGQQSHNLMAEIRVANSTAEALVCEVIETSFGDLSACVFFTITVHWFKQPVHNDIILVVIEKIGMIPDYHMVLEYFPEFTKDDSIAPISTKKLRDDTVVVADYMARIGSSFFADFNEHKVYILYDKAEIEAGLEIPLWVLIAAGTIMLVSVCVWQLTQWLVGPPHTSSLYSIIRTRLAETSGTPVPRLMRFKLPLMFEDVNLLPDQVENLLDETETLPDETGTLPEDIKSEWVQDKEK